MKNIKDIKFCEVFESQIRAEYYDFENEELYLMFQNESVYVYKNVTSIEYRKFINAESEGKYFHKYIKGIKQFKKISNA